MPTKIKTPQENMVSKLVDLYIQGHKDEIEKAKEQIKFWKDIIKGGAQEQIKYWEGVIEREENYIAYLNSFNNL